MQTLLTSAQMHDADAFTIKEKPITSIDLMESAANAFVDSFIRDVPDKEKSIAIFCGQGNNGGDGLAIARLLVAERYRHISVFLVNFSSAQSDDYGKNLKRIKSLQVSILELQHADLFEFNADFIIDAILGSGLNKPLSGDFELIVHQINQLNKPIYAVDVPTGFFADGALSENYNGIKAYKTICFQRPKINFFFPESLQATEEFEVVNIGLDEAFIQAQESNFFLIEETDVKQLLWPRKRFSHKGTFGHALIVAGNTNTMGAALLASKACLHAGVGLITACIPQSGLMALNALLPEVMALPRDEYLTFEDAERYSAIAVGPGIGDLHEHEMLIEQLIYLDKPLIIDADAINILSRRPDLLSKLAANSILTPHVKEFDKLFGLHANWWERVQTAKRIAKDSDWVIVLKNQYTFTCMPNGKVYINSTGNPAMAQGGMGDILTGLIASFVAQGYSAAEAAIISCYVHGKAGDTLAETQVSVAASQIAEQMPKTIKEIMD